VFLNMVDIDMTDFHRSYKEKPQVFGAFLWSEVYIF
jgi:hypothetical protein